MNSVLLGRAPESVQTASRQRSPHEIIPLVAPRLLHPCWLAGPSECLAAPSPLSNAPAQSRSTCTPALRRPQLDRASPRAMAMRYVSTGKAYCWHLCSTSFCPQPPVLFETHGQVRKYILNRPKKLNALDTQMIDTLRPFVEVLRGLLSSVYEGSLCCVGMEPVVLE